MGGTCPVGTVVMFGHVNIGYTCMCVGGGLCVIKSRCLKRVVEDGLLGVECGRGGIAKQLAVAAPHRLLHLWRRPLVCGKPAQRCDNLLLLLLLLLPYTG